MIGAKEAEPMTQDKVLIDRVDRIHGIDMWVQASGRVPEMRWFASGWAVDTISGEVCGIIPEGNTYEELVDVVALMLKNSSDHIEERLTGVAAEWIPGGFSVRQA